MSKVLIISDIHIHDYPQRNPKEKYRLYQTRKVTNNILEVAKIEAAEYLIIAGDIMDKWNPRPYVQAEIKLFLDTLMDHFKEGWIIWGNHDQDNKTENSEFIDSCLNVMLPQNLHYADQQIINIGGCVTAFENWRPKFDLSWIPDKVDLLVTHATIAYNDTDQYNSQKLDETKFDLAICGDIHRAAAKGKYVSIGIPQKCKMGDSDTSSGILFDTTTKQWKWVDLDPNHNLMKFTYTEDRDNEGWDATTGTWKVFKPNNLSFLGGVRNIVVPAWKETGHLIQEVINQNQLSQVHGEVLLKVNNIEGKEVDFNFTLLHFRCKNWRSIEEADLYFDERDRILMTGENGSGKSSLLSAIKYAFLETRNIKDYIQFGSKECETEVEFSYQENLYKIQRGFRGRGGYTKFWINGEEQKSNNKSDMDEDLHVRFPFIDYMDFYFFDSDHHKLIGGITSERKFEIISKFYKMDKIDAYHEAAKSIFQDQQDGIKKWEDKVHEGTRVLEYIDGKLGMITLPDLSKTELEQKKQRGLKLQEDWRKWNTYVQNSANLRATEEILNKKIIDLELQSQNFRDSSIIQQEIDEIEKKISQISTEQRKLESIKDEGLRIKSERENLDKQRVCQTCGRPFDNQDAINQRKQELEKRHQELGNAWRQQKQVLDNLFNGNPPEQVTRDLNSSIAARMSEMNEQSRIKSEISSVRQRLLSIQNQIMNLGEEPQKIILPDGFMEEMAKIETSLSEWEQYNNLMSDRAKTEKDIEVCQKELQKLQNDLKDIQDYIKLTGPTGKIYEEIMTRLAEQFSDTQVKYKIERTRFRGKDYLDLASYYLSGGNEVSYQACSSGQKTILDVNFLGKVVTRMGLLVMDEFLKHLDSKNHDICIDMLKEMNIGCILLSSHMESVPAFNNKSITLELNESGISKIQMK